MKAYEFFGSMYEDNILGIAQFKEETNSEYVDRLILIWESKAGEKLEGAKEYLNQLITWEEFKVQWEN